MARYNPIQTFRSNLQNVGNAIQSVRSNVGQAVAGVGGTVFPNRNVRIGGGAGAGAAMAGRSNPFYSKERSRHDFGYKWCLTDSTVQQAVNSL